MQRATFDSAGPSERAFPVKGHRHVLLFGIGCTAGHSFPEKKALELLRESTNMCAPNHVASECLPNWIEPSFMNAAEVSERNREL